MAMTIKSNRSGCGPIVLTLLMVVFLALGLFALYALGLQTYESYATWAWDETTCTLLESELVEDASSTDPFRLEVRYRWETEQGPREGTRLQPGYQGHSDRSEAGRLADRYPAGAQVPCWVDPGDPTEATLQKGNALMGLWLLVPLVFVLVGGGGIYLAWKIRDGAPGSAASEGSPASGRGRKALSSQLAGQSKVGCWMVPFFLVFLAVGLGLSWLLLIRPMMLLVDARGWNEEVCTVTSSMVGSHQSDDGTTYSIEIAYTYEIDGRTYSGNRYHFMTGSSSGYEGKAEVVEAHPVGGQVPCYVSPEDPWESVLNRSFTASYLWGLFPLLFALAGAAGLPWAIRTWRRERREARREEAEAEGGYTPSFSEPSPGSFSEVESPTPAAASRTDRFRDLGVSPAIASLLGGEVPVGAVPGLQVLEPQIGRWGKVFGALFLCLFWNGIVSVFLWQGLAGDGFDGCLLLFMVPFVLVGLALLASVPYTILALANPRVHLELDHERLAPGTQAQLTWRVDGKASRISRFVLRLKGEEKATYRRGTDSVTDSETFHSQVLYETTQPMAMERGTVSVQVPADTMHSLNLPNNKILWHLEVAGEIARWPDVGDSFPVQLAAPQPREDADAPSDRWSPAIGVDDTSFDSRDPALQLHLEGDQRSFEPGSMLRGEIRWDLRAGGISEEVAEALDRFEALELRLFWLTEGRGTRDSDVVETLSWRASELGGAPSGRRDFELRLPAAPLSVSGTLVSIVWAVEAVLLPSERSTLREIVLVPGGREIRLEKVVTETDRKAEKAANKIKSFFGKGGTGGKGTDGSDGFGSGPEPPKDSPWR